MFSVQNPGEHHFDRFDCRYRTSFCGLPVIESSNLEEDIEETPESQKRTSTTLKRKSKAISLCWDTTVRTNEISLDLPFRWMSRHAGDWKPPTCPDHSPCRCHWYWYRLENSNLVVDPLSIWHSLVANRDSKLQNHFPNSWHRRFGCLRTFSFLSLKRTRPSPLVFESHSSTRNGMAILCALQGTTWPNGDHQTPWSNVTDISEPDKARVQDVWQRTTQYDKSTVSFISSKSLQKQDLVFAWSASI